MNDVRKDSLTSDDEVARLLAELYKAERDGLTDKAPVLFGPWTAFATVAALQLALRHPELPDNIRIQVDQTAHQLCGLFDGKVREALEDGFDPAKDRD